LEEIFKIKNEIGSPSLSTPIGQIIASQAILNTVISDYRWEITNDEIKKLICGYYGELPRDIDKRLLDKLFDSTDSLEKNTKFKIKDIYTQCKNEISNLTEKEEDVISYCFFPEKTIKFLQQKNSKSKDSLEIDNLLPGGKDAVLLSEKENIKKSKLDNLDIRKIKELANLVESSNINEINLELEGVKISINKLNSNFIKKDYKEIDKSSDSSKEKAKTINNSKRIIEIKSPIVGTFYRAPDPASQPFVKIGDRVKKGDTLCIIEAMKLMNKINSDYDGKIKDILIKNEEPVEFEQIIMLLEKDNND
jgi:oxaloacetate decarboxylase alpha subunit